MSAPDHPASAATPGTRAPDDRPWLRNLTAEDLRPLLDAALDIYVTAMGYPQGTQRQRRAMWQEHSRRPGWRFIGAFAGPGTDSALLGVAYGYRGAPGQWWHDEVRRGVLTHDPDHAATWLTDYFELTELHVHPDAQGRGLGRALLRALLDGESSPRVLLSTPEGTSRAWRLYRSLGFGDVLRDYRFTGDPRPFAVLGRTLPL